MSQSLAGSFRGVDSNGLQVNFEQGDKRGVVGGKLKCGKTKVIDVYLRNESTKVHEKEVTLGIEEGINSPEEVTV